MGKPKRPDPGRKLVWRISEAAPLGEFVDPDVVKKSPKGKGDAATGGWVVSSFELLNGTEISEDSSTVPDELFDEWFPASKPPPDAGSA